MLKWFCNLVKKNWKENNKEVAVALVAGFFFGFCIGGLAVWKSGLCSPKPECKLEEVKDIVANGAVTDESLRISGEVKDSVIYNGDVDKSLKVEGDVSGSVLSTGDGDIYQNTDRKLDQDMQMYIKSLLNRGAWVRIIADARDAEAGNFAEIIQNYLIKEGYMVIPIITQTIDTNPNSSVREPLYINKNLIGVGRRKF